MNPSDAELRRVLQQARTIVVVGMSKNPEKDAHTVPLVMHRLGYQVIPVNPTTDEIAGLKCYKSLRDVPGPIDIVDVFRPSEDVPPVMDDAIDVHAKTVWLQLGIRHAAAAEKARKAGLTVVEDRCIKVEHRRLLGS